MNPISSLLERWRRGRERIGEGEEAREAGALEERGPGLGALDGESIRVKAPSTETADELVDVLRKHGVAGDLRRPHGSEVEVVSPDDVPIGETMRATVHGVELWLLLPDTPDSIEINCGKEAVLVNRPDLASETGASTPSAAT